MWIGWAVSSVALGVWGVKAFDGDGRAALLPGPTTHGHYQIELECGACHTEAFAESEDVQAACEICHADELEEAHDSHPRSKFTDPRNADRVALLDARLCVTCHVEHRPDATLAMGLTLPEDYCVLCHEDVAEDRPTHEGLGFGTCASAGCHNFHDNRGLYEDYLLEHRAEPAILAVATVAVRELPPAEQQGSRDPHGEAAVVCVDCHGAEAEGDAGWSTAVPHSLCADCHEEPATGFLAGRHGMRIDLGLSPMTPAMARLPMREEAHAEELGCTSCHGAHSFDTAFAAVEACTSCHDDEHTRAYVSSPHAELWRRELAGEAEAGSGVSCATCHLPREAGRDGVHVEHDQNANLRPNEKMVRSVCTHCHGLGFTLDSLADAALVERNFAGRPGAHVESIEMAVGRRRDSSNP